MGDSARIVGVASSTNARGPTGGNPPSRFPWPLEGGDTSMRTVAKGGRPNNLVGLVVAVGLLAGCPDPVPLPPSGCTPGAQVACACPGASSSVQVCQANRTLGPCQCGGTDGGVDAAAGDAGEVGTATPEAGAAETGVTDLGSMDLGALDTGGPTPDLGVPDAGVPDTGTPADTGSSADVLPAGCVATTPGNCCGVACPAPDHASPVCAGGACTVACMPGYVLTGATCADACLTGNGGCDAHATCGHSATGVTCTCQGTYAGDGRTCADVGGVLSGQRWLLPCVGSHDVVCACSPTPVSRTVTFGGATGVTYDVVLRLRGVVEQRVYLGGSQDGHWYVGGATPARTDANNIYSLAISNPAQQFYLNAAVGPLSLTQLDYMRTVRVTAGATLTLTADGIDGAQLANRDSSGRAIVINGIPPAPMAYDGQFVQVDVLSVTAR